MFCCSARISTNVAAEMQRNTVLLSLTAGSAPFLNFIENIGISLTRRSDSSTEAAGMIHGLSVTGLAMLRTSRCEIVAKDPQSIAQAGVARPMKFSVCLSSMLNFASLSAENTTMISQRVKLFSHRGVGVQSSGGKTVTEIAYCSCKHEIKGNVDVAAKSSYHTKNAAEDVHGSDSVRYVLGDLHLYLMPSFLAMCFGRASL